MIKIMLVCSAGMSTSLLVGKIQLAAKEKNIEIDVFAASQVEAANYIGKIDVMLLGPQVRYLEEKMEKLWSIQGTKIEVIDSVSYGTMDGTAVLQQAIELVK